MQDYTHMPVNRNELHALIDGLPESEIPAAQRFLQFLTREPAGSEFAESIRRGKAQADAGDTVTCRDYREMVESLLGDDQSWPSASPEKPDHNFARLTAEALCASSKQSTGSDQPGPAMLNR